MGLVFSSLWSSLFGSKQRKVVIVGLDNAGKTILHRLNLGAGGGERAAEQARPEGEAQGEGGAAKPLPIQTVPTIGANVERLKIASVEMECWDLGGQVRRSRARQSYKTTRTLTPDAPSRRAVVDSDNLGLLLSEHGRARARRRRLR